MTSISNKDKSPKISFQTYNGRNANSADNVKNLRSTSTPNFQKKRCSEHNNLIGSDELNNSKRKDLCNKRRDEILETFIKETEEKYEELSLSREKTLDGLSSSSQIIDTTHKNKCHISHSNKHHDENDSRIYLNKISNDVESGRKINKTSFESHSKFSLMPQKMIHSTLKSVLCELSRRKKQSRSQVQNLSATSSTSSKTSYNTCKDQITNKDQQTNTNNICNDVSNVCQSSGFILNTNLSTTTDTSVYRGEFQECYTTTNTPVSNCEANIEHHNKYKDKIPQSVLPINIKHSNSDLGTRNCGSNVQKLKNSGRNSVEVGSHKNKASEYCNFDNNTEALESYRRIDKKQICNGKISQRNEINVSKKASENDVSNEKQIIDSYNKTQKDSNTHRERRAHSIDHSNCNISRKSNSVIATKDKDQVHVEKFTNPTQIKQDENISNKGSTSDVILPHKFRDSWTRQKEISNVDVNINLDRTLTGEDSVHYLRNKTQVNLGREEQKDCTNEADEKCSNTVSDNYSSKRDIVNRKKLSKRLPVNTSIPYLAAKSRFRDSAISNTIYSSASHDSFYNTSHPQTAVSEEQKLNNLQNTKVPSLKVDNNPTKLSSRSVYLSSQSCENFANFNKNDFKSALQRLKSNTQKEQNSPSPITAKVNYTSEVKTLYEIPETPVSQNESDEKDQYFPSRKSSICSIESYTSHSASTRDHTPTIKQPKQTAKNVIKPKLASQSQEKLKTPILPNKMNTGHYNERRVPSYGLKMKHQSKAAANHNTHVTAQNNLNSDVLYSKSHDIIRMDKSFERKKHIDLDIVPFSPLQNRRQADHRTNAVNNHNVVVQEKNTLERPKTGRGRKTYSPESTNTIQMDFDETNSIFSDDSISTSNSSNGLQGQSDPTINMSVRPKSSKGRSRQIVDAPPQAQKRTSVFSISMQPVVPDVIQPNEIIPTENHKQVEMTSTPQKFKTRPKSSKGRFRPVPVVENTRPDSESLTEVSETAGKKTSRPKSSKGRTRNTETVEVVSSHISETQDCQSEANKQYLLRPKSAKGRTRDIVIEPSHNVENTNKVNVVKREKIDLSIDSLSVGSQSKKARSQAYFTHTSNAKSNSGKTNRNTKYFKPQSELEANSDNDTDVDGEIEILDLDKLASDNEEADSDDFPVSLPRSPKIGIPYTRNSGYTNSSRSSSMSDTSNTAWDSVLVDHYGNRYKPLMTQRQLNNKTASDIYAADMPRLTPKHIAAIKQQNYEEKINTENYSINSTNRNIKQNSNLATTKLARNRKGHSSNFVMKSKKKSCDLIDEDEYKGVQRQYINNSFNTQHSKNGHQITNEAYENNRSKKRYRAKTEAFPTAGHTEHSHPTVDSIIIRTPSAKSRANTNTLVQYQHNAQPKKLQPIQSLTSFEPFEKRGFEIKVEKPLYSQSTATFQRYAEDGNVNNCNSSQLN